MKRAFDGSFPFSGGGITDIRVGDVLEMKKPHPCGNKSFLVLRAGMDFRLRCEGCSHEFMVPRAKAEKYIRKVIRNSADA